MPLDQNVRLPPASEVIVAGRVRAKVIWEIAPWLRYFDPGLCSEGYRLAIGAIYMGLQN